MRVILALLLFTNLSHATLKLFRGSGESSTASALYDVLEQASKDPEFEDLVKKEVHGAYAVRDTSNQDNHVLCGYDRSKSIYLCIIGNVEALEQSATEVYPGKFPSVQEALFLMIKKYIRSGGKKFSRTRAVILEGYEANEMPGHTFWCGKDKAGYRCNYKAVSGVWIID